MKAVDVAEAVEVETAKRGRPEALVEEAAIETRAKGEVVPIPT